MGSTPNKGKKLSIEIDQVTFDRLPIKTHRISSHDSIVALVDKYTKAQLELSDIVVISERVVAITQGRSIAIDKIKPSWLAKKLYRYVYNHPGGIGLRDPHTMEMAIREAGGIRILIAAGIAGFLKPFKVRGIFYHLAGNGVNAIDGPTPYTLPPGNTSVTLGPKDPKKVVANMERKLGYPVAIIDANDFGVRIIASSKNVDKKLLAKIFADNPMGQAQEQTPIVIVRKQ